MIGPIIARNTQPEAFTAAIELATASEGRYFVQKGKWSGIWYAAPLDISGRNR